jgi:RNA polymerase sigma-70 factor, ECF subfamily
LLSQGFSGGFNLMHPGNFEEILERFGNRIFQYLRKLVRSQEDAEDIYQNVFIAFHAKADDVQTESIEAYLFRTAYHHALNFIKSRQRKRETELPEYMEIPAPETDENPVQSAKNRAIREAFLKLAENEATALHMQYYEQKSYREIAEMMRLTESAVESLLVRGKRKLRTILAQEMKTLGVLNDERGET